VIDAGEQRQLTGHIRRHQATGVVHILIPEQVLDTHTHVSRWQAGQLGGPGGRRVKGGLRTQFAIEVHLPGIEGGAAGPDGMVFDLPRRRGVQVIDHGVYEQLEADRMVRRVTVPERQPGRQTTPGTGATNGDTAGINAQTVGVIEQPVQGVLAIVHGRGVRVLWREAVVHGKHGDIAQLGKARRTGIIRGTHDIAATVNPQQRRLPGSITLAIDMNAQVTIRGVDDTMRCLNTRRHGRPGTRSDQLPNLVDIVPVDIQRRKIAEDGQ